MEIAHDEYKVWSTGIYKGTLYCMDIDENQIIYSFYPGFTLSNNGNGLNIQSDKVVVIPTVKAGKNQVITDDDISKSYAQALAKKICMDTKENKSTYLQAFLSFPDKFYSKENCYAVVQEVFNNTSDEDLEKSEFSDDKNPDTNTVLGREELACRQFMEYAHKVNPKIELETKVVHTPGKTYLPPNFGK